MIGDDDLERDDLIEFIECLISALIIIICIMGAIVWAIT